MVSVKINQPIVSPIFPMTLAPSERALTLLGFFKKFNFPCVHLRLAMSPSDN